MQKKLCTVNLHDEISQSSSPTSLSDVQLWYSLPQPLKLDLSSSWRLQSYIKYLALPLYLYQCWPLSVYSKTPSTVAYFAENVASLDPGIGLLSTDGKLYMVYYYDHASKDVRALCLAFDSINAAVAQFTLSSIHSTLELVSYMVGEPKRRENTAVFDKVLQSKKQIPSKSLLKDTTPTTDPSPRHLMVPPDQINRILGRLVLAGLRVRGISTNLSHLLNDRLSIKELYQMTIRSATFALRKYANPLNGRVLVGGPGKRRTMNDPVPLDTLQGIVESLLEVFVDVDDR